MCDAGFALCCFALAMSAYLYIRNRGEICVPCAAERTGGTSVVARGELWWCNISHVIAIAARL